MPSIKNKNSAIVSGIVAGQLERKEGFEKFKVQLKKSAQGAKALIKKVLKKKENSDLFSKKVH
tara:strand:+ start:66 stop:254 length:189 start_codon:yes stop_codon:yes gene_type:complete